MNATAVLIVEDDPDIAELLQYAFSANGFQPDVIERQLAHAEKNSIRAAYNHAEYLPQRRELMQWWPTFSTTRS